MFDLLIKNGTIIDGTKQPRFRGDVGIRGTHIQQIGSLVDAEARQVIDAAGKIVAPGFIDVHTHSDGWLLRDPHFFSKTSQGFTTELLMADGISYAPARHLSQEWIYYLRSLNGLGYDMHVGFEDIGEYMALLDGRTVQNVATHIPYANLRALVAGFSRAALDDYQIIQIQRAIEEGMNDGAVGLSTGLDYIVQCFASTDELAEVSKALGAYGGLYVTHVRYKKGVLTGLQEAVEIGIRAGVPVHISHLKGATPQENEAILDYINRVAVNEVDFSFDVYPYTSTSTMLNYLLPYEVWEEGAIAAIARLSQYHVRDQFSRTLESLPLDRITIAWVPGKDNSRYQGKTLADYCDGRYPGVLTHLLIEEGLAVLLTFRHENDDLVADFLAHDRYMMGTDGIYFPDGVVHPRVYGSAARLIGRFGRDQGRFSLEEAVYKLSGYPAARFGLANRGVIREGSYADLVIFDADTIIDRASYEDPHRPSAGVSDVIVNGVPIIHDGAKVEIPRDRLPGRYLRFNHT